MTACACLPEPPCDWLITTSWPVFCFHCASKALLIASYNSRVGSYDTLSSVSVLASSAPQSAPTVSRTVNVLRILLFINPPSAGTFISLKRQLPARVEDPLDRPVAGAVAALEARLFIIGGPLHELIKVPIHAHRIGAGARSGNGRIGEFKTERFRIDLQLLNARGHFPGAPGPGLRVEVLFRRDAPVRRFLAGQHVRRRRLP